ncbi:MAG: AtpZ/AtpI family protein [Bdellovibrionota bacterium]
MNRHYIVFTALGFECVGLIAALAFFGSYIDEKYGWTGIGVASGVFIGLIAWLLHVILILKATERAQKAESPDKQ